MVQGKQGVKKTVLILMAFIALMLGLYVAQQKQNHAVQSVFHGTRLDKPRDVVHFSLMGIDEKPFTDQSLRGHWTFVFFGFTHCRSICPTTMAELGKMYRLMIENKVPVLPRVVMISLDPERDDSTRLGQYVRSFDSHFYGARGDSQMIEKLTRDLGIAYMHIQPQSTDKATELDDIEHSGAIMLFNPNGKLVAFFTGPHQANNMVEDYSFFLTQGNTEL